MAVSFQAVQAAAATKAAQQKAATAKATPAKATTTYGAPAVIAKPASSFTQSLNLYGSPASNAAKPVVNKPVTKTQTKDTGQVIANAYDTTGPFNKFGGVGDTVYGPTGGGAAATTTATDKIVISRKPRLDSKGRIIGYDIVYSDGTTGFEPNPDYKPEDATKEKVSNVAYDTIGKILESYRITGIAAVLESIRDEYPEISSDDIVTLLQFDSRYNAKFNERFAANVDRLKAGKPVLSPGEYLKLEQGYAQVLNAYNLPTFNTQKYYDTFIKSDLDVVEVTDRVQLAYDRVLSDDPVNTAFKQFFPSLGLGDIVTGMLDPVNQLPALQRKVKAAEIGGAALRQGFKDISETATSMTVGADVLAQQGVTKAEAEAGYQEIAQQLPQAEKFSSIYAGQTEAYGRLEAEKEQLQGLASEERKKKRLIALETAQFGGDSGTSKASVNTNYLNRQSGAGQY